MNQYPLIEITASDPYERGFQYGSQAKEWIDIAVAHYYKRFEKEGHNPRDLDTYAMGFVPVIKERCTAHLEEARGIAEGSGHTMEEIMVVNCRYEISKFPKESECTTAAVLPPATRDGKTYLIKNWDYSTGIMPHVVMLRIRTPKYRAFGVTEAGQLIREGFNHHGVAFANNNLQSKTDHWGAGIPVTFFRKMLWECEDFESACGLMQTAERCVSCNTLIAADGQARNFEAYPGGADVIDPVDHIITHANHFVVNPDLDGIVGRPKNRDQRLRDILMSKHGDITPEYIMTCMRDHKYHNLSICGHPNPESDSGYDRDRITVSSTIMNLTDLEVWVAPGPPCQSDYVKYTL